MSCKVVIVAELKASQSHDGSDPEPGLEKGKQVIDEGPNATVATSSV